MVWVAAGLSFIVSALMTLLLGPVSAWIQENARRDRATRTDILGQINILCDFLRKEANRREAGGATPHVSLKEYHKRVWTIARAACHPDLHPVVWKYAEPILIAIAGQEWVEHFAVSQTIAEADDYRVAARLASLRAAQQGALPPPPLLYTLHRSPSDPQPARDILKLLGELKRKLRSTPWPWPWKRAISEPPGNPTHQSAWGPALSFILGAVVAVGASVVGAELQVYPQFYKKGQLIIATSGPPIAQWTSYEGTSSTLAFYVPLLVSNTGATPQCVWDLALRLSESGKKDTWDYFASRRDVREPFPEKPTIKGSNFGPFVVPGRETVFLGVQLYPANAIPPFPSAAPALTPHRGKYSLKLYAKVSEDCKIPAIRTQYAQQFTMNFSLPPLSSNVPAHFISDDSLEKSRLYFHEQQR